MVEEQMEQLDVLTCVCVCVCVCVFQKDSGDEEEMDKLSGDEDMQLEEQIERLQEKVESAQSEQKNLFLVIFQVGQSSPRSSAQRIYS